MRRTTILSLLRVWPVADGPLGLFVLVLAATAQFADAGTWSDVEVTHLVSQMVWLVMLIIDHRQFLRGLAGAVAAISPRDRRYYAWAIRGMLVTYGVPREYDQLWWGLAVIGVCQGVFALFTMYLPPLFPTLLRTTGAGFCFNFGRIAAGIGTVFFGLTSSTRSSRTTAWRSFTLACLFLPAAVVAWMLPELEDEKSRARSS